MSVRERQKQRAVEMPRLVGWRSEAGVAGRGVGRAGERRADEGGGEHLHGRALGRRAVCTSALSWPSQPTANHTVNRALSTEAAKCRWSTGGAPAVTGGTSGVPDRGGDKR